MPKRVLLAMSGGVDSSVAAYLLCQQGHEVIGLFMRTGVHEDRIAASTARPQPRPGAPAGGGERALSLPVLNPVAADNRSQKRGCCSAVDAADARRVADKLDIPFYAVDFAQEFGRIMDYFVEEYTHGRTPNPCVMCNNWLKFGRLWEYAQQIGADHIATGHYARIAHGESLIADHSAIDNQQSAIRDQQSAISDQQFALLRARDSAKDQSYVLFGLKREILPHLLFPIGEFTKPEVRQLARELGLRVADKPDSQEICFVPTHDYLRFLHRRVPEFDGSGEIVDTAGTVIGRHDGFEGYTIGQRKGLGVALGQRRYVVKIDAATRRVVIGSRDELRCRTLRADCMNWLCEPPVAPLRCEAKIRYHHQAAPAVVTLRADHAHVEFDEPQSAITPGQAVVFYEGDRLLGGGYIR